MVPRSTCTNVPHLTDPLLPAAMLILLSAVGRLQHDAVLQSLPLVLPPHACVQDCRLQKASKGGDVHATRLQDDLWFLEAQDPVDQRDDADEQFFAGGGQYKRRGLEHFPQLWCANGNYSIYGQVGEGCRRPPALLSSVRHPSRQQSAGGSYRLQRMGRCGPEL